MPVRGLAGCRPGRASPRSRRQPGRRRSAGRSGRRASPWKRLESPGFPLIPADYGRSFSSSQSASWRWRGPETGGLPCPAGGQRISGGQDQLIDPAVGPGRTWARAGPPTSVAAERSAIGNPSLEPATKAGRRHAALLAPCGRGQTEECPLRASSPKPPPSGRCAGNTAAAPGPSTSCPRALTCSGSPRCREVGTSAR